MKGPFKILRLSLMLPFCVFKVPVKVPFQFFDEVASLIAYIGQPKKIARTGIGIWGGEIHQSRPEP